MCDVPTGCAERRFPELAAAIGEVMAPRDAVHEIPTGRAERRFPEPVAVIGEVMAARDAMCDIPTGCAERRFPELAAAIGEVMAPRDAVHEISTGRAERRHPEPAIATGGAAAGLHDHGGRRRLWEIWSGYHCSICGTCLSLAELRKIAGKAGLRLPPEAAEYEVHGYFVKLAAEPGRVAKSMQKLLDRKYRTAVAGCRRLESKEELRAFWTASLAKGDVPGPYWALMTHPLATEALTMQAFGDVHMLSHLVGASNRGDIRRLNALEGERGALSEDLAAARRRLSEHEAETRRMVERHATEVRRLESRAQTAHVAEQRLAEAEARIRELEQGEAYRRLEERVAALAAEREEVGRANHIEVQRRMDAERELAKLRLAHDDMASAVRELGAECKALEGMLHSGLHGTDGGGSGDSRASIDLHGRRIAYVGGRTGIIGHFRALVERLNGQLIHHDGGIDDSEKRLARIVGQADAVLCPVDCVSHGACLLAKQFCKRTAKPFVPLRSAGLSSFITGIHRVATAGSEGGA